MIITVGLIEAAAVMFGCTVFGGGIATVIVLTPKTKRAPKTYRRARALDLVQPEPDQGLDPFVDEDTADVPALPGSLRFALGSGVTDLGVRFRSMRRAFADESAILRASAGELLAVSFRPTASIFADPPEHFLSEHIDAALAAILDCPSWANVTDLSLLEELTRRQPGMPTGQHAIITQPGQDPKPDDGQKPKLIGQPRVSAEVLHAIWNRQPRPQDEMPTPMPRPTNPAVAA